MNTLNHRVDYWNKYYSKNKQRSPSQFAMFCLPFMRPNLTVVDAGCGCGCDSLYFAFSGHPVIAIDNSLITILNNGRRTTNSLICWKYGNVLAQMPHFADYIYARWLLHAMNNDEIINFLHLCYITIPYISGRIFIECRSYKDKNIINDDHYRNPINLDWLTTTCLNYGYNIVYTQESRGLSKLSDQDDPLLIRMVLSK